jgi:hypothetical protein
MTHWAPITALNVDTPGNVGVLHGSTADQLAVAPVRPQHGVAPEGSSSPRVRN